MNSELKGLILILNNFSVMLNRIQFLINLLFISKMNNKLIFKQK